jgi:hypothetical protein
VEARENESSIRDELIELLRSRGGELIEKLAARVHNSEVGADLDAEGLAGLRLAAAEAIQAIRERIEAGDRWPDELPSGVVATIQYTAREGRSLDELLRGFAFVGTTMFEFVSENLDELSRPEEALRYLTTVRSLNEDRMMAAFAAEYDKEMTRLAEAPARRLADRIAGLLDGGQGDFADLEYRLDGWHLGLIARGPKAELACRRLAERLGCELLLLPRPEDTWWAWLGAREEISVATLRRQAPEGAAELTIATGEPRYELDGWRATHREARAALAVALLGTSSITRYSDVALLAAALSSEVAGKALLDRYLEPLDGRRDGIELRRTLRAYLDAGCNAASAAAALAVDRHTVQRRLRRIEQAVGEPPASRQAEFDVALQLEQLTAAMARLADAAPLSREVPIVLSRHTQMAQPKDAGR